MADLGGVNSYEQGSRVRLTGGFTDASGSAVDPATVKFRVRPPGGLVTEYVYGTDAALVKDSPGNYHVDVDADTPGQWVYRFFSTGTGKASKDRVFNVSAAAI